MRPGGKSNNYGLPDASASGVVGVGISLVMQGGSNANNVYGSIIASTRSNSGSPTNAQILAAGVGYAIPTTYITSLVRVCRFW